MKRSTARCYVFVIFVLAFVVRLAYALITPAFQAPDEYSHYSYVQFLHHHRQLPVQPNPAIQPEELEFHQPPLYYAIVAPLFRSTQLVESRPLLPIRFINILFSMLTIWIVYYFASSVFEQNPFIVAFMCAGVALLPTYSYLSATIRNGVLATFCASLGFHLCARAVLDNEQQGHARWSWIGVVAGLAMLSNLDTVAFAGAAAVLVFAASSNWRILLQRACWFGLGVTSTAGWWFFRNWIVYGQWVKIVENGASGFSPPPVSWEHEKHSAIVVFKTFWAVFGRINEFYFADIYRFYWWFVGLAAIGMILYAVQKRQELPKQLTVFFASAVAVSVAATLYYAHNYNSDQGRYMFPTLIPIMTFIAIGLNTLFPERYHRLVLAMAVFAFAAINALVLARLAAIY